MKTKNIVVGITMPIALCAGLAWAEPQMNTGKWEITTKTEMAGMPTQTATHIQCITKEDLVPMSQDANQECQVTDIKTIGNTVLWKMACGGQGGSGRMEGTGKITYQGDTMQGIMEMTILDYNMEMKNTLSGRRIGTCDDTAADRGGQSSEAQSATSESTVGNVIAEDAKDFGQTAKDEAKQGTKDEIRRGVRGALKSLFN
jgi:hypothetical protein